MITTARIINSAMPPPELPVSATPWPANADEISNATSHSELAGTSS